MAKNKLSAKIETIDEIEPSVGVCVCSCPRVLGCVYAHIHVYVSRVCVFACTFVCVLFGVCVCMCAFVCVCLRLCVCACVHACVCACMGARACKCMYVYARVIMCE